MRQFFKVVAGIMGFTALVVLLALLVAIAAMLAVITPIVIPILALLSGGGLLVAIGFACAGHWQDATKALWACLACSFTFSLFVGLVQVVNPWATGFPVTVMDRRGINRY